MGDDPFATINSALAGVDAGGTIHVAAGTYVENVIVTKAVTLLGPNALIDPNTGSRVAEAVLMTAVAGAYQSGSDGDQTIMDIHSGNVTVKGLTFDGNNPALTGGVLSNGIDVDASSAIWSYVGGSNIVVENNIITSFSYAALQFYNWDNGGAASSGNAIRNNKLDNMMPPSWGIGILLYNNFYAEVTGNVLTRTRTGIQTGNYYQANTGRGAQHLEQRDPDEPAGHLLQFDVCRLFDVHRCEQYHHGGPGL
ncbi:MAG: right-handed parallel beta-helix repeat-containing protein [Ignavibacteriae bacterium]|nr:right-handed parallel beta-helix repeat-containing protein [Ignavibacteriota bacterium]